MWFLRRNLWISWVDKVTNEEVLRRAGMQRELLQHIRKRQMAFLGQVYRKDDLERTVLTGKIHGKRIAVDRGWHIYKVWKTGQQRERVTKQNFLDQQTNGRFGGAWPPMPATGLTPEEEEEDKEAPFKKKYLRANDGPFMTRELRKAIMKRSRLKKQL